MARASPMVPGRTIVSCIGASCDPLFYTLCLASRCQGNCVLSPPEEIFCLSLHSKAPRRQKDQRGVQAGTATLHVGDFTIALPDKHPLIDWQRSQPYRDQHIGISAGLFGRKYPRAALIDIGANVGDSAARMASHCRNDLILIEPSPLYLKYLKKNAALFRNKTMIEEVLIGGEPMGHGNLVHTGGTAYFEPGKPGRAEAVRHKATLGLSRGRVPHQM